MLRTSDINLLAKAAKAGFLALAALLLASCAPRAEENVDIYVSIPPLLPFAQRLAGPDVKCESFMPSGANPHSYEPSPRKGSGYYASKLFIMTGLPFEQELVKRTAKGKGPEVLDLFHAVYKEEDHDEDHDHDHDHEEHHGHHHDPHIWLSPKLMLQMVGLMAEKIETLYPEKKEEIEKRKEELEAELVAFDEDLKETFENGPKTFLTFHPAYSSFACDYVLTEIAVEKEGSEPTPKSLAESLRKAGEEKLNYLIIQPGLNERLASHIARSADLKIIKRDALSTNYYGELRALAKNIKGEE